MITVSVVRANIDLAAGRTTRSTMMLEVRWEGDKDVQVEDEDREGEDAVIHDVCWIRINRKTTTMNDVHEAYKIRCTSIWHGGHVYGGLGVVQYALDLTRLLRHLDMRMGR